jgi:GNAT superfamily N-acetyltransferase
MLPIFHDTSTAALTEVVEANLKQKALSQAKGNCYGPNPEWFMTGQPLPTSNGVVYANFDLDTIEAQITATLQPFIAQAVPLTWWVGPATRPANLGVYLQQQGFKHNRDMIGMAMDLHDLPVLEASELTLELVTPKTFATWHPLVATTFRVPPALFELDRAHYATVSFSPDSLWQHYMGWRNGELVATSSLHFGAGVAGLYNVATPLHLRQQGLGRLMTLATLHLAREQGYRIGTLQSTNPSALRLYHRMGFEIYGKFNIYEYYPILEQSA